MGGLALLALATYTSKFLLPTGTTSAYDQWGRVNSATYIAGNTYVGYGVGIAWIAVLLVAFSRHTLAVRQRYATGERWRSFNSGVPRHPALIDPAQYIITGLLAAACFYWGLIGYGSLLTASLVVGMMADHAARTRFWNSVLDTVDAQIESENLRAPNTMRC